MTHTEFEEALAKAGATVQQRVNERNRIYSTAEDALSNFRRGTGMAAIVGVIELKLGRVEALTRRKATRLADWEEVWGDVAGYALVAMVLARDEA